MRFNLLLVIMSVVLLTGCNIFEPDDECDDNSSCVPTEVTYDGARAYIEKFILDEQDDSISSEDFCNMYYDVEIVACIAQRDEDLALNAVVMLHSFEEYMFPVYRVGVLYEDDETEKFLEYHNIHFYLTDNYLMRFDMDIESQQYDVDYYREFIGWFVSELNSDLDLSILCMTYLVEDEQDYCQLMFESRLGGEHYSVNGFEFTDSYYSVRLSQKYDSNETEIIWKITFVVDENDMLKIDIYRE